MAASHRQLAVCPLCKQQRLPGDLITGELVREPVRVEILLEHPEWNPQQPLCLQCLNRYRAEHVCRLLATEKGELTNLEQDVVNSLREQESLTQNLNLQFDKQLTFGEQLSDRMARFGGSWTFILVFWVLLAGWISLNSLLAKAFDPYPYILLNLMLSCLAAIQAPIILMSQNRQEVKDRLRGEYDYRVDLKAELEIRLLHAKLDQLLMHQWQRLLEIQQLQLDLMGDLSTQPSHRKPPLEHPHQTFE